MEGRLAAWDKVGGGGVQASLSLDGLWWSTCAGQGSQPYPLGANGEEHGSKGE